MKYASNDNYTIYNMSCLDLMDSLEENSIDAIVTDPPYEIGFMNKGWDNTGIAFNVDTWKRALRVLKPGGYLLAFNHSRTFHRMMVAIEDAGFELRDTIMWLYGSGFPKSHNIAKAIDKSLGVESEIIGKKKISSPKADNSISEKSYGISGGMNREKPVERIFENITKPTSPQAKQYEGYGTALKPAFEPIVMARKPFKTSVAENVLKYGTGGINIDECRIDNSKMDQYDLTKRQKSNSGIKNNDGRFLDGLTENYESKHGVTEQGRFPANIIHDGTEEATRNMWDWETDNDASRYFYCAKASAKDRDEGLDQFDDGIITDGREKSIDNAYNRGESVRKNIHPTVKPTDLMQYLVRLVTPRGGTVLDIFMGSGSTGKATMIENTERDARYHFIGVDLEKEYCEIAQARIEFGINFREIEKEQSETLIDYDDKGNAITMKQIGFDL